MYHFIAEIDLDNARLNHLVFKMLDEDKDNELNIIDIIRHYVNLPKNCRFASELRKILRYYLENSIKPDKQFRRRIEYNFTLFSKLIPMSCLSLEIKDKFFDRINKMNLF